MNIKNKNALMVGLGLLVAGNAWSAGIEASSNVKKTQYRNSHFSSDPQYDNVEYDAISQLSIYGDKKSVTTPRALLELGRPIYKKGEIPQSQTWLGEYNPVTQQFLIYGDMRLASSAQEDLTTVGARIDLQLEWKFTATERLHASMAPLENNGEFTRIQSSDTSDEENAEFNFEPLTLFFEGDLGAISSGILGRAVKWDLPFVIGKMPLEFQNGYFLDDVIEGVAVSVISKNSPAFNISNYDVTLFAAIGDVDQQFSTVNNLAAPDEDTQIFGLTSYLDASDGHWEFNIARSSSDDTEFVTSALGFTRRYGSYLSNSIRIMHSSGTADAGIDSVNGTLLVLESSIITSLPSTLIPYLNVFIADDSPQPIAITGKKQGVLNNIGIAFESDALMSVNGINAVAKNNLGGAIGIEYLFDLSKQLVFEAAMSDRISEGDANSAGKTTAFAARYQQNINTEWAYKIDALIINSDTQDNTTIKIEVFNKF